MGQIFLLAILAISPFTYNPWLSRAIGMGIVPILVPILAFFPLADRIIQKRSITLPLGLVPAVIFIFVGTLTLFQASSFADGTRGLARAFVSLFLFPYASWLIFKSLTVQGQAKFLSRAIIILVLIAVIGSILAFVQRSTDYLNFLYLHPQGEPNAIYGGEYRLRPLIFGGSLITWGIFLVIPTLLLVAKVNAKLSKQTLALVVFLFLALLVSGTRAAWIGVLAGAIWLVWRNQNRHKAAVVALTIVSILVSGILGVDAFKDYFQGRTDTTGEGFNQRFKMWKGSFQMVQKHPVLGVGIGNFHNYTLTHPEIAGEANVFYYQPGTSAFDPHSTPALFVAETGLLGLAAFLWLLWQGWRNFNIASELLRSDTYNGGPLTWICQGLQAASLGLVVVSFFQRVDFYVFTWFLLAASFMLKYHAHVARHQAGILAQKAPVVV
jgi:hypothetical protein